MGWGRAVLGASEKKPPIFELDGSGGRRGGRESWSIKSHLEKRRFRRDMVMSGSFGAVELPCEGDPEGKGLFSLWEPV